LQGGVSLLPLDALTKTIILSVQSHDKRGKNLITYFPTIRMRPLADASHFSFASFCRGVSSANAIHFATIAVAVIKFSF